MAHVLFVIHHLVGAAFATLEFSRRLRLAGHTVTYASAEDMRRYIEPAGYPYLPLSKTSDPPPDDGGWVRRLLNRRARLNAKLERLGAARFASEIGGIAPDLILLDIELFEHTIAAHALGVPVAVYKPIISLDKHPNVPPLHLGVVPGVGFKGSGVGIELLWLRYRVQKWREQNRDFWRHAGTDRLSTLRAFAAQTGFPFRREVARFQWLKPYSYQRLPTIILNAHELDIPHTPRPSFHFAGAMVYAQPERMDGEQAAKLEALLAANPRPLIYCAFGATYTGSDLDFWRRLIAAAADHPEWTLIAGLGGREKAEALGDLPPNFHAFGWLPQTRLLQRADAAILHAGVNSVTESAYFGVPMLLYPYTLIDQRGTAARAAYHGIALVGSRDADSPATIGAAIARLLSDSGLRERVQGMSARLRVHDQRNRPAEIVEALLKRG